MESEFPVLDPAVDFPPLTPDWSPPPSFLPTWGPPPKIEEVVSEASEEEEENGVGTSEEVDDPPWAAESEQIEEPEPKTPKLITVDHPFSIGPYLGKSEEQCYYAIEKYLLTEEERIENGYPHFAEGRTIMAVIKNTKYYNTNPIFMRLGSRHRTCCRCNTPYQLIGNGPNLQNPVAACSSHLKPTYDPIKRKITYPCCNITPEAARGKVGCVSNHFHVFHHIYDSELFKFVQCPESTAPDDFRRTSIYALDCEMVYTSNGPALARLSLVDVFGHTMLDLLVKPAGEIYDANTKFSGLTLPEVESAVETLESCRAKLFHYVSRDSILIGHSLEADLKALRLVHEKIVDTSILFMQGRRKKGLRTLASELLNKELRRFGGHDSREDARTCTMLVAHRLDMDAGRIPYRDGNFNNVNYITQKFVNMAIH